MEALLTVDGLTALLTLSFMEIVLGIDNIVFISILTNRAPKDKQNFTQKTGIILALGIRIVLLFFIKTIMGLTQELFVLFNHSYSFRDLILLGGGLFLIAKSTFEIHTKMEGLHDGPQSSGPKTSVASLIIQILILDIVFSLDSVITAVGMAKDISVMVTAMCIAMVVMLISAKSIGDFVNNHPTVKILALSFLILIGVVLVAEGMGGHVGKGYIYFAMFFSLAVELINMRYRTKNA